MTSAHDTDQATTARHRALLDSLSHSERLARMFALSDFARQMTVEGARRYVGPDADQAIARERLLIQMYGPDEALRLSTMIARAQKDG